MSNFTEAQMRFGEVFGSAHPKTTEAYAQANAMKRRVIEEIEELEYRMASLEK
jgi:hypothetical protein